MNVLCNLTIADLRTAELVLKRYLRSNSWDDAKQTKLQSCLYRFTEARIESEISATAKPAERNPK